MRLCFGLILILVFFSSCDDGDIEVTTFDFEDQELSLCGEGTSVVLFNINNQGLFESLSFKLSSRSLSDLQGVLTTLTNEPITIPLSGNNEIIYRSFDGPVPNDYFCSAIPPANPRVIQEFRSVGGTAVISTFIRPETDHDRDGIPSAEEGMAINRDTDGDGIPDYLDIDDDGDNVRTSVEIVTRENDPTAGGFRDTDGDGVPNYLDTDDDGDGVPTRREVTAQQQDPVKNLNEANIPWYLDPFTSQRFEGEITFKVENVIPRRFQSVIEIENLKLRNMGGDIEEISFTLFNFGFHNSAPVPTLIEPEEN